MDDLDMFDFSKPTPEEIEKQNLERKKKVLQNGFLPENDEFHETMISPQEDVEKSPRTFIIEECIPACEELWKKNIYTYMVSDHLNVGVVWIEIISDSLSEENLSIYEELQGDDIVKFSYHKGAINFGINKVGLEGQQRLLDLAKQFKTQDVPYRQAYITIKDFLMEYCDCYDIIPNPDYVEMTPPWETGYSLDEFREYTTKYSEWSSSIRSIPTLKVFNPKKQNKSLEELVNEHNMILEGDRVYLSKFHYEKHLKYLKSLEEKPSMKMS